MMATVQEIEIPNKSGKKLNGRFVLPVAPAKNSPLVLMLTGDGAKGSGSLSWINLPKLLAEIGVTTFVFDFQGLGKSEGNRSDLSLSQGLSDAISVLDFLKVHEISRTSTIAVLGSSFGGNVAILLSKHVPNCAGIFLKSPVSFYPETFRVEMGEAEFTRWIKGDETLSPFSTNFYYDAFNHNTYAAASNVTCSCLITHGDIDQVVPLNQSTHLRNAMINSEDARLEVFQGVGHSYSEPGAWDRMAISCVEFFGRVLGGNS